MKKGQNLVVQAINANGAPLTLPLPLAGEFAKAYDGPPTDPKVFEENQKKLQEELQKRPKSSARSSSRTMARPAHAPIRPRSKRRSNPGHEKGARFERLFCCRLMAAELFEQRRHAGSSSARDCAGDSRRTCP